VLALGAQAALLGTRFLLADEMPIHEEYRRRLVDATETDAEWYPNLYEVGWPDASHRAIHNSTAGMWEAADRPAPGSCQQEPKSAPRLGSEKCATGSLVAVQAEGRRPGA
jgi:NAD(P)H-dependent flavin oxidoreductase YrpB (nitropropane dioxygenase family)